ncbi:glycosyltransferase family 4 protein [Demequina sp.]|uniref:glycosyltransferase family 4 protein n=1 Tax=Demequina sp. TaxID=2050685 RepID=UPI003D149329
MKIALVLDDSIDRPDGVQQYVRSLRSYLERVGHEVHVLCSVSSSADPHVHSLARNASVRFNGNGLRTPLPASRRAIREVLAAEDFDVIHVQTPHSPVFAGRVVEEARKLRARSVRIVATFHILPDGRVSEWGTKALGVALRKNLRKFDAFAAVSAPAAAFAAASFGIDCRVIPIGIDLGAFRRVPERERGRLRVAFLGRLVERKGVLELLEALPLLEQDLLDRLDVRIAGRGPLLDEAENAVVRNDLADVVSFVGFVSEEDKPQFLADADIAVFPATGGESFGIVLIEAMASGAGVVLAGANPGYLSVIGPRPEVSVDATDATAFAAALTRLVEDAALREELHAAQQEHVKSFDLDLVGARVMRELYGVE